MIGNLQETPLKYMNVEELKNFRDNGMDGCGQGVILTPWCGHSEMLREKRTN